MKRFLPYIAAAVVILLIVVLGLVLFFVNKNKKTQGPIVLHYLGLWDPEIINPLKAAYQKDHPNVVIEYEQKDRDAYFPYLKKALDSHTAPDIFWVHNGWQPALSGQLAPLPAEVISNANYQKSFYPITKEDFFVNGSYQAIPLEIDGLALFYNKDLLAAKKFSPPKDYDSLTTMASLLTVYDNLQQIQVGGVALGSSKNVDYFSEIVGLLMLQNKVTFVRAGQNIIASNNSLDGRNLGSDAFGVFNKFVKDDKVWNSTLPSSLEAFATGKVAMAFLPTSSLSDLSAILNDKNIKLNYGVAPVPQVVASDPVSWGSYWANSVNALSKNQLEAWRFVEFLSRADSLRQIFSNETKISGYGRAYPRVDMAKELEKDPLFGPFIQQAAYAKSWYLHSQTGDNILNAPVVASLGKWLDQGTNSSDQLGTIASFAKEIQPILVKFGIAQTISKL